jgi:transcriptional/translational regulatory protein YebC/TACO1
MNEEGDQWRIATEPTALHEVRSALETAQVPVSSAELSMIPQNTIPLDGSQAKQVLNLIDALDELEDVQSVYANFDIPDEVLAEVS